MQIEKVGTKHLEQIEKVQVNKKDDINVEFREKLDNIQQEQIREELKVIFTQIEKESSKLQNKLFIEDLVEYKKLVKKFLHLTVNNSHVFFKENFLDRRGRHRVYSLVKMVDNELDELTKDFLDVENNRLKILKRLNDIKGLLLDILT